MVLDAADTDLVTRQCSFFVFGLFFCLFCFFVFLLFLGPPLRHMEVPRLGVESEP